METMTSASGVLVIKENYACLWRLMQQRSSVCFLKLADMRRGGGGSICPLKYSVTHNATPVLNAGSVFSDFLFRALFGPDSFKRRSHAPPPEPNQQGGALRKSPQRRFNAGINGESVKKDFQL